MILDEAGLKYGKAQQLKDGTIQVLKDGVFVNLTNAELQELEALAKVKAEETAIKAHNSKVYLDIEKLESKQARPLREVYLDPENQEAKDKILLIDSEIEALRATLK